MREDVPVSDTLLLRPTYPELESSLLAQFRRDVPRDAYVSYNEAKHLVALANSSTIRFGYCRNENDVYQYQGAEFLFIGIDELTHFTLKQWQFLTSRNRCQVRFYASGCGIRARRASGGGEARRSHTVPETIVEPDAGDQGARSRSKRFAVSGGLSGRLLSPGGWAM